jgi:multidrug efflux pump
MALRFPEQDTGIVLGQIIADQAISFPTMSNKLAKLQTIVQKDPGVASVFGFAGSGSAGRAGNTANIYIELKPLAERGVSAAQIVQRLRPKLNGISGARLFLQAQQDLHMTWSAVGWTNAVSLASGPSTDASRSRWGNRSATS